MRKSKFLTLLTASFSMALLLAMAGIAEASFDWVNNPKNVVPNWATGPMYFQRNIYWDFESDPSNKLNWDYEGYRDPDLKDSDLWSVGGDMSWDGHAIGVSAGESGSVTITLDNLDIPTNVKRIYLEGKFDLTQTVDPGTFPWSVVPIDDIAGHASGYLVGEGLWYLNWWFIIGENPVDEAITWTIPGSAPAGGVWLTELHIATECIPVPGTLLILAPGLLGFVAFRRNRSRKTA